MVFQVIGAILFFTFYLIFYGKKLILKKKGIKINQVMDQSKGREKWTGFFMGISTISLFAVELFSILSNTALLSDSIRIIGIVIALGGNMVFFLSVYTMGDSWRAGVSMDQRTKLVTKGIYSYSRNPAFLGFYLNYIGILLMFFSYTLLAFTVLAIVFLHLQVIWVEEPSLPSIFGEEYKNYASHTKRYFGRK